MIAHSISIANVVMAEVVVENGYRMHGLQEGPSFDGDTQQECGVHVEPTMGTMDLDGQLMQEQFHSNQVGCISSDFDVNDLNRKRRSRRRIGSVM